MVSGGWSYLRWLWKKAEGEYRRGAALHLGLWLVPLRIQPAQLKAEDEKFPRRKRKKVAMVLQNSGTRDPSKRDGQKSY